MADKGTPQDEPSLEMPSLSPRRKKRPRDEPTELVIEEAQLTPDPEPVTAQRRGPVRLPAISGIAAALVTGAAVGGLAVLLTWLAGAACGAVRGTSSCGGGPGLVIMVASLVLLAYVGGWFLQAFGVTSPGSTSLLGVGVMAVLALAFFSSVLDTWWMVVVVPLLAMAAYSLSWWLTTTVAQEPVDPPS